MESLLSMDIECFSDVDLIKCGVYAYADSPAFEILLFAFSFDGGETQIIDLAQGEKLPAEVEEAIFDVSVTKTAYNANFERTCLSKHFGRYIPPESWHCSAVQAAMLALPRSLEDVGRVLGLDEQKMKEGKELIKYFCVPCKPTKANGGRTRNLPCHAPEKWELFKTYCKRDVDVEKAIRRKLHNFPIPESEMELYRLDQRINDRGVLVDMGLVEQAIACERLHKEVVTKRAYELTGLENPNSVVQLKGWLGDMGMEAESLSKKAVAEIGKGSPERAKGKVASLSCQYGGSKNGLISMGALDMGLTEEELPPLVAAWRKANPHMVQFWWDVDAAAIKAVTEKQKTKVGKIIFEYKSGILFITLPSGRKLSYVKPRMAVNRFGRDGLTYEGISENKKWSRIETYGPKLVENIVQGTARDLLAEAMLRVEKKGYPIVMHCHDEIIAEVPEGSGSVDEMCEIMAVQPEWAEGLPLRADGFECRFYKK